MKKQKYYAISFSGGKDSTCLTLKYLLLNSISPTEYPLDEIVFCDTYMEFPDMITHIAKVEKVINSYGFTLTRLKSEKSFEYYLLEHKFKKRMKKAIYHEVPLQGYGWAGSRSRWCTNKLKQDVIAKHFRELDKIYDVIHLIGIAVDEQYRLDRKNAGLGNKQYPLVEWNMTEADCLKYCYDLGYDWNGLYEHFSRVSCWCCPLQSLEDLRKLRTEYPDLWTKLRELDNKNWRVFSGNATVEDLEVRFQLEEKYIMQGLPIRTRKFFNELKSILPPPSASLGVIKRTYYEKHHK